MGQGSREGSQHVARGCLARRSAAKKGGGCEAGDDTPGDRAWATDPNPKRVAAARCPRWILSKCGRCCDPSGIDHSAPQSCPGCHCVQPRATSCDPSRDRSFSDAIMPGVSNVQPRATSCDPSGIVELPQILCRGMKSASSLRPNLGDCQ